MRIVIVEDHQIICDLLRKVCVEDFGHEVIAAVATAKEAIAEINRTKPELVILDLMLPDSDGFTVVETVRRERRAARILAISARCDAHTVLLVEEAGLDGFIDKRSSMLEDFRSAIEAMAGGRQHFSPAFLKLQSKRRQNANAFEKLLTKRQRAILTHIGDMLNDQEVAKRVDLSVSAVETNRYRMMRKLGLKTRSELVRYARINGFRALSDTEFPEDRNAAGR
jgi:DNA-binding NarL/FixJ family response regulator